jgi:hypothetical protein
MFTVYDIGKDSWFVDLVERRGMGCDGQMKRMPMSSLNRGLAFKWSPKILREHAKSCGSKTVFFRGSRRSQVL